MNRIKTPASFEETRFWKRIEGAAATDEYASEQQAIDGLKASLPTIVKAALDLSDMVHLRMTQYTDHRSRHLHNVLGIMDALVPDEAMAQLHPLECALCILTAFTHDLGMVMGAAELERLQKDGADDPEAVRWREYRAGYAEEVRHAERLAAQASGTTPEAEAARRRVQEIEEYLLASYLREHHTDPDANRIDTWLKQIQETAGRPLYHYGPYDYRHHLSLVGLSHGHPADWLRLILQDQGDFPLAVGDEGYVNLAYPALLLRLADVMDFDASRAPRILFQNLGISDEVSLREWRKHLAVTCWRFDPDKTPALQYRALHCPSPVVHKSILSFVDTIRDEGYRAEGEADAQRHELARDDETAPIADRYRIHALGDVAADVKPKKVDGRPLYIYSDIQFRLDEGEVLRLLMGEALYGDPSLCLRELAQNALDALQLRDLRWQLVCQGKTPAEPVDPVTDTDPLRVEVSWGKAEDGTSFIRVRDNGVGMTKDVIERYFTQVGKSFYRSAAFERERALLKRSGKLATPISHFGIGILSCFMIADRMVVRTHPGGIGKPGRARHDVSIQGPGSLFWMSDGTLDAQGTEVTLFLKEDVVIEDDSRDNLIERLRSAFDYIGHSEAVDAQGERDHDREDDPTRYVDPAYTLGRYVVWPTYPIHLTPPDDSPLREDDRHVPVIDGTFHLRELAPLRARSTLKKAAAWDVTPKAVGKPHWVPWDFEDEGETGSRIRIWTPRGHPHDAPFEDPSASSGRIRQDDIASYVETTLEKGVRTMLLVKGMHVPNVEEAFGAVEIVAGIGTRVWIDLRGDAAPVLLASREAVRRHPEPEAWAETVRNVFARARMWVMSGTAPLAKGRNLRLGLSWSYPPPNPISSQGESASWVSEDRVFRLLQEAAHYYEVDNAIVFARDVALARELSHGRPNGLARALISDLGHGRARDGTLERSLARDRGRALALTLACSRFLNRASALQRDLSRGLTLVRSRDRALLSLSQASFLQEQYFPSLDRSFPRLHLYPLIGQVSAARLLSPAVPTFQTESDDRTVVPFFEGLDPVALARLDGYDLVFPLTAVPLGPLRRDCPLWGDGNRAFRLGTAPFLFPEFHDVWPTHAEILHEWLSVDGIHALLPPEAHWETPFADWTDADWDSCETAHWDVITGEVFWADGVVPRGEMRERGVPTVERFPEVARLGE